MVPPATPTPTRRREGGWRDPHHNSSVPYPYEYEAMSPNPFSNNRGPPAPASYHYDSQGPPPRGPPGPPRTEYWHSPSPYSNEDQRPPPPVAYRGGGGPYWTPPLYDGYRGVPPRPGSLRGPPHGNVPHPSQHQHRTPSRRSYVGEEQPELEPMVPQPSLGDRHPFHHNHQRKDFTPPVPAPATASGQVPATRGVQVAVSASADSEEVPQTDSTNQSTNVNTTSPKKDGGLDNDDDAIMDDDSDSKKAKKEKGDPLSVLADVSAGMGGKNKELKREKETGEAEAAAPKGGDSSDSNISGIASDYPSVNDGGNRPPVPMPAPTSPLQRRLKPSPITPSQTPQVNNRNKRIPSTRKHQPITPSRSHDTASTAEGVPQSLQPSWEAPPLPHEGSGGSGSGELYSSHPEYNSALQQSGGSPSRRNRSGIHYGSVGEFGPPFPTESPALVERGSFDSHGDTSYRGGAPPYPPSTPTSSRGGAYFYDDHPPPPPGYGSSGTGGGGPYWDSGQPPYSPTYPPPNRGGGGWNHAYPPTTHSDSFYGSPLHHGPPADYSYPLPPPHYGAPEDQDIAMYGGNLPPHPSYHHRGGPPPPLSGPRHPGMSMHPPHMGGPPPPYPYGHPPRMEEKTILRKKFSWKHYPEVRRNKISRSFRASHF
jgi:hypothetical protein